MAKKTIVYEVILVNGHKTWTELHVALTRAHLEEYFSSKDIKVKNVSSLGQHVVTTQKSDNYDAIVFNIKLDNNKELNISHGRLGYKFLCDKFKVQADKCYRELREFHE